MSYNNNRRMANHLTDYMQKRICEKLLKRPHNHFVLSYPISILFWGLRMVFASSILSFALMTFRNLQEVTTESYALLKILDDLSGKLIMWPIFGVSILLVGMMLFPIQLDLKPLICHENQQKEPYRFKAVLVGQEPVCFIQSTKKLRIILMVFESEAIKIAQLDHDTTSRLYKELGANLEKLEVYKQSSKIAFFSTDMKIGAVVAVAMLIMMMVTL